MRAFAGEYPDMNRPQPFNRYMLVPRTASPGAPVKRYSLARVGDSRRSALGRGGGEAGARHERLERAASFPA